MRNSLKLMEGELSNWPVDTEKNFTQLFFSYAYRLGYRTQEELAQDIGVSPSAIKRWFTDTCPEEDGWKKIEEWLQKIQSDYPKKFQRAAIDIDLFSEARDEQHQARREERGRPDHQTYRLLHGKEAGPHNDKDKSFNELLHAYAIRLGYTSQEVLAKDIGDYHISEIGKWLSGERHPKEHNWENIKSWLTRKSANAQNWANLTRFDNNHPIALLEEKYFASIIGPRLDREHKAEEEKESKLLEPWNDPESNLGTLLKAIRDRMDLTLDEMSKKLGEKVLGPGKRYPISTVFDMEHYDPKEKKPRARCANESQIAGYLELIEEWENNHQLASKNGTPYQQWFDDSKLNKLDRVWVNEWAAHEAEAIGKYTLRLRQQGKASQKGLDSLPDGL